MTVGPLSVGFKLTNDAVVFGGEVLTATDIAVACGLCDIGNKERIQQLTDKVRTACFEEMTRKIEAALDRVKVHFQMHVA